MAQGSRAALLCPALEVGVRFYWESQTDGALGAVLTPHLLPEAGQLCVRPGLVGHAGQSLDLCEPRARLLDGADALAQVAGRSDEMSVAAGASWVGSGSVLRDLGVQSVGCRRRPCLLPACVCSLTCFLLLTLCRNPAFLAAQTSV